MTEREHRCEAPARVTYTNYSNIRNITCYVNVFAVTPFFYALQEADTGQLQLLDSNV